METNNKSKKKLIIICGAVLLAVAMVMAVFVVISNNQQKKDDTIISGVGNALGFEMSYEDFTFGLKVDRTDEEESMLMELYEEFKAALAEGDNETITAVFEKLDMMNLFDENMISQMIELSPEELAELDLEGNGFVVIEDEGESRQGFRMITGTEND